MFSTLSQLARNPILKKKRDFFRHRHMKCLFLKCRMSKMNTAVPIKIRFLASHGCVKGFLCNLSNTPATIKLCKVCLLNSSLSVPVFRILYHSGGLK